MKDNPTWSNIKRRVSHKKTKSTRSDNRIGRIAGHTGPG